MDTQTIVIIVAVVVIAFLFYQMQQQAALAAARARGGIGQQIGGGIGSLIEGIVRAAEGEGGQQQSGT